MTSYEYGVGAKWDFDEDNVPHREGMTQEQATEWVRQWDEDNRDNVFKPDLFFVIRRPTSPWERVEDV